MFLAEPRPGAPTHCNDSSLSQQQQQQQLTTTWSPLPFAALASCYCRHVPPAPPPPPPSVRSFAVLRTRIATASRPLLNSPRPASTPALRRDFTAATHQSPEYGCSWSVRTGAIATCSPTSSHLVSTDGLGPSTTPTYPASTGPFRSSWLVSLMGRRQDVCSSFLRLSRL